MLLANKYVAEHVGKVERGKKAKHCLIVFTTIQTHKSLKTSDSSLQNSGYKLKSSGTKGATARALNALMDEVEGKSEQKVIQTVALRSMMKAKYTTHNIGHFGLAFDYYTHFTSPIRRYPDTIVHRLLTRYENGGRRLIKNI